MVDAGALQWGKGACAVASPTARGTAIVNKAEEEVAAAADARVLSLCCVCAVL